MFGRRRPGATPDPDALEEARAYAQQLVLPGFVTRDEAAATIVEVLEDSPLGEAGLVGVVDEVVAARRVEEEAWTDEGDYTRVAAGFADLEAAGILARMNFTCCQTCGHAEIHDERTGGERGYVFFHQQDSERLADPDAELFLAFGVFGSHPAIDQPTYRLAAEGDRDARDQLRPLLEQLEVEISNEIVATMQRHGLRSERRDERSRPAVQVPDWRKRIPV